MGHSFASKVSDDVGVNRHLTPPENLQALLGSNALNTRLLGVSGSDVAGQKGSPHGIRTLSGKLKPGHFREKQVRNLGDDSRTITSAGIRTHGTSVLQIAKRLECLFDDVVTGSASKSGHHGQATGVAIMGRVIEPLCCWLRAKALVGG